jgi:hypothetical protein
MRLSLAVLACTLIAVPARAQTPATPTATLTPSDVRIPLFAIDARATLALLGQDPLTADGLSTTAVTLPSKGLGGVAGVHVYLLRRQSFAFGVGGEAMLSRAHRDLTGIEGTPSGTVINRRLRALSAQVSLNFGHRDGWSYLTAGFGPTSFESYLKDATPDGLRPASLNFGGGARWFNTAHLAFTADMRFYTTKPALATPNTAARARRNVIVFSAGVGIK